MTRLTESELQAIESRASITRDRPAPEVLAADALTLLAEVRALQAERDEQEQFIDSLGNICCGVAFTTGQYEEHNERMRTTAECAYCREAGPRTPEAMTEHAERCAKHPLSAARAEVESLRRERDGLREAQAKWLLSPEAARRLDGYRELGAKCAALEGELDAARAELATMVDRMPLTADAQHAYESGLMERAEKAGAELDAIKAADKARIEGPTRREVEKRRDVEAERDRLAAELARVRADIDEEVAAATPVWFATFSSPEALAEHDDAVRAKALEEAAAAIAKAFEADQDVAALDVIAALATTERTT